jgi:hypothetical protein
MTELEKLFDTLEKSPLIAYANTLSGLSSLVSAFEHDETLKLLVESLMIDPHSQDQTLERLRYWLGKLTDDTPIFRSDPLTAAYLYALHGAGSQLVNAAITDILNHEGFFWARRLALQSQAVLPQRP